MREIRRNPMILPPEYSARDTIRKLKPTRGNSGWWLLAILILLCALGFIYEFLVNVMEWDIKVFTEGKAYYFDLVLFLVNGIFAILSMLNPIIKLILDTIAQVITSIIQILNPDFGLSLSFQFSIPFQEGDTWFIIIRTLAAAAVTTLQISLISIAVGFFIAIFLAVILVRPGRVYGLKTFSQVYVDFFRSTPLLVQLFLIFFGVPALIQSFNIPGLERFTFTFIQAAVIGLSLNTAAYQAEIIRAGILAIPTGQTEAARALGMTSSQTMLHVILPQALRIIIPPFTNEGINIILNSSLASSISTWELTRAARNLSAFYFLPFEIYLAAALFYFVMAFSLAKLTKRLEKRMRIPGLGVHHD